MFQRFIKDESGVTMGLTVIMVVLIGVMGAGLLTFVSRDLNAVVEVNQGQMALEAADAGVEAAKQQLVTDLGAEDHYDGGADDLPWSYCYNVTLCTGFSPTATGSAGMRINLESGDYADVTILGTDQLDETYKVISQGRVGDARRKVEAVIRQDAAVSMAPAYFSRSDIAMSGSINPTGSSFFAVSDVEFTSNVSLGTSTDAYFGSWAETSGVGPYPNATGSFPNTYNQTARTLTSIGVAAQGQITGTHAANAMIGTRSFDSDSVPYRVVPDYNASPLLGTQKIAFPFDVPTPAEDKAEIDVMRQRALALEVASPGSCYYIDSNPCNGQNNAGLANGSQNVNTWPAGSTYETVVFYEFTNYDSSNSVSYTAGAPSCGTTTNRGAIVVENGDVRFTGNRRFDGAVIVRAYTGPGNAGNLIPDSGGIYDAVGTPCLYGYINTSGDMNISGNFTAGTAPELSNLATYRGTMETVSWRELYE